MCVLPNGGQNGGVLYEEASLAIFDYITKIVEIKVVALLRAFLAALLSRSIRFYVSKENSTKTIPKNEKWNNFQIGWHRKTHSEKKKTLTHTHTSNEHNERSPRNRFEQVK